jgi:predicted ABC-type sugar transport system permease subunit
VLFLGFLRVLEEWKKWEILYKKSYKILIFYRYVRMWRLIKRKRMGIYIYGMGGLVGAGTHPPDGCLPFI